MKYRVVYQPKAVRALSNLPKQLVVMVHSKLEVLALNPYGKHNNATKLQGQEGYRLRIGNLRVLYSVDNSKISILVLNVLHRRKA